MRRVYFGWSVAVLGIFGTVYGAFLLAYHFNHGHGLNVLALLLLIFGLVALSLFLVLYLLPYLMIKKKRDEQIINHVEDNVIDVEAEPDKEEAKEIKPEPKKEKQEYVSRGNKESVSSSRYSSYSSAYVKLVGHGPLLRVEGNRILDMRNNTYYRIENNIVNQEGYGPVFEIRGNQIRDVFGGYLYEISGSNINKVYGGFYASISGNYITLYDLSEKYEMTDSLSKRQMLVVVALLFGK